MLRALSLSPEECDHLSRTDLGNRFDKTFALSAKLETTMGDSARTAKPPTEVELVAMGSAYDRVVTVNEACPRTTTSDARELACLDACSQCPGLPSSLVTIFVKKILEISLRNFVGYFLSTLIRQIRVCE